MAKRSEKQKEASTTADTGKVEEVKTDGVATEEIPGTPAEPGATQEAAPVAEVVEEALAPPAPQTVVKPTAFSCPKCGSIAINFAGGGKRCNQCGHQF